MHPWWAGAFYREIKNAVSQASLMSPGCWEGSGNRLSLVRPLSCRLRQEWGCGWHVPFSSQSSRNINRGRIQGTKINATHQLCDLRSRLKCLHLGHLWEQ